jgi:hypothetical protein
MHVSVVDSFFKDFMRQIKYNSHFPHVWHSLLLSHGPNLDKTTSGGMKNLKIMTGRDNSQCSVLLPTLSRQTSKTNHYGTYLLKSRYAEASHYNTERPQSAVSAHMNRSCVYEYTVRVIADNRKLEVWLSGVSPADLQSRFTEYSINYWILDWEHLPDN